MSKRVGGKALTAVKLTMTVDQIVLVTPTQYKELKANDSLISEVMTTGANPSLVRWTATKTTVEMKSLHEATHLAKRTVLNPNSPPYPYEGFDQD